MINDSAHEFASDTESDDELVICLSALYLLKKRKERKSATKIARTGLLGSSASPSAYLLSNGTSSDIEAVTRMSGPAFEKLFGVFNAVYSTEPLFGMERSHRRVRSRVMSPQTVLMLTLCYLANGSTHKVNSLIFGVSSSSVSRYVNHGLWVLLKTLRQIPESRVAMPTIEEVNNFATTNVFIFCLFRQKRLQKSSLKKPALYSQVALVQLMVVYLCSKGPKMALFRRGSSTGRTTFML